MKIIAFLPIIIFFGIFAILVLGFLGFIAKMVFKTKKSYWKGVVIDKNLATKREERNKISSFYSLAVKTTEGQIRNVAVTKAMYDQCAVGDTLEKPIGALNPVKAAQ